MTIRELREDFAPDRRHWIPQDPRGNGIVGQFARGLLCPLVLVVTFQKHPALEKLLRDCYNCPNPRIDRDIETLHEYKVLIYHFVSRLVSTMRSFFEPIGILILKVKERDYIFFPFPPISKSLLAQYICFVPNNSFGRR